MGRYWFGVVIACAIGGATWLGPRAAEACSCAGSSSLVAPVAAEHPVGAPVYFVDDCGGNLEAWSVTVDGAPAMLENTGVWSPVRAVAIEPTPAMGAEVVLTVDCGAAFLEPECTDSGPTVEKARFTIAGPDTTSPPPLDGVALELEDGEFQLGCDDTTHDLRLGAVIDVGDAEPSTWIEVTFTRSGEEIAKRGFSVPETGDIQTSHHVVRSEVAGAEVCVAASMRDAAGNFSEIEQDCAQIEGEGCGCTADPRRSTMLSLLGLALLVLRPLRRRPLSRRAR